MRHLIIASIAVLGLTTFALADDDDDDDDDRRKKWRGNRPEYRQDYRHDYWRGVERAPWNNGRGHAHGHYYHERQPPYRGYSSAPPPRPQYYDRPYDYGHAPRDDYRDPRYDQRERHGRVDIPGYGSIDFYYRR